MWADVGVRGLYVGLGCSPTLPQPHPHPSAPQPLQSIGLCGKMVSPSSFFAHHTQTCCSCAQGIHLLSLSVILCQDKDSQPPNTLLHHILTLVPITSPITEQIHSLPFSTNTTSSLPPFTQTHNDAYTHRHELSVA